MVAAADTPASFNVEAYLQLEREKDLLRFSTAGSVDDGKSTLIGRLLYDSRSIYEDQIQAIAKSTVNRSAGPLDLSLLTDGLRAEREQGITIDVAYRYFATARRKFIIADTPGHEQYTRNMATGASTADLAIVLIDARNGVLPQSRRHAFIATLLGIPKIVVAVNKMDLEGYREDVFNSISAEFRAFLNQLGAPEAWFVPISALNGDNVVTPSAAMPWFSGPSLLEYLETVEVTAASARAPFRFPVQRVIRPDQNFRGFSGQVASGIIHPGDSVTAWPSGRTSRVKSIETWEGKLARAGAPQSVTLTFEDEIDVSRGDLLSAGGAPQVSRTFDARVVWMNEAPLDTVKTYLLKHTTQTVPARVRAVKYRVDVNSFAQEQDGVIGLNAIGLISVETARAIYFDAYRDNRITGAAILIDPETNATAGALMIERSVDGDRAYASGPVTATDRAARWGHGAAVVHVGDRLRLAETVERRLFDRGAAVVVLTVWTAEVEKAIRAAGLLAIVVSDVPPSLNLPDDLDEAASMVIASLRPFDEVIDGEGI